MKKIILFLVFVYFNLASTSWAAVFVQGKVTTAANVAVSGAPVYLICRNSIIAYQNATTDINGYFSFDASETNANAPCNKISSHPDLLCHLTANNPATTTNGAVDSYGSPNWFTPACKSLRTEDVVFDLRDRLLRVTVSDGSNIVTSAINVFCSPTAGGLSFFGNTATGSVYDIPATAAVYSCYARCSTANNCPYSQSHSVTIDVTGSNIIGTGTVTVTKNTTTTLEVVVSSSNAAIAGAAVTVYSYNNGGSGTAFSSAGTTSSSGYVSFSVPAGTYTVSVTPPSSSGYGSATKQVTLAEGTSSVVQVTLEKKGGRLTIKALDESGSALSGVRISGWVSAGGGKQDYISGDTNASGTLSVDAITDSVYTLLASYYGSNSNICSFSNEGEQSVKASADTSTVTFVFPPCDHTLSIFTVDETGAPISGVTGAIDIQPEVSSGSTYQGLKAQLTNGVATAKVESNTDYVIDAYFWDVNYVMGDTVAVTTGGSGKTTTANITLLLLDASITGRFLNLVGNAMTLDSAAVDHVFVGASKGKVYRGCEISTTSYTCTLSAGKWCLGQWMNSKSGYAVPRGENNCKELSSGQTATQDITLYPTAVLEVIALDPSGSPLANVWVEAKKNSSASYGDADSSDRGEGCVTDSSGTCTIQVGTGSSKTAYYLHAYLPHDILEENGWGLPAEVSISVSAGSTTDVELSFTEPDSSIKVTVFEGDTDLDSSARPTLIEGVTVDLFSSTGGFATGLTDPTGTVTLSCSVGSKHKWYAVAYRSLDKILYMSEVVQATCEQAKKIDLGLDAIAELPECQSRSFDAGSSTTLTCTDGFSVSFPAESLATTSTTVDVVVAATLTPFMPNVRPASLHGYAVTATNRATGQTVVALNSNAVLSLPCDGTQVSRLGLGTEDLEAMYYDSSVGAYKYPSNFIIDGDSCTAVITTDHLTDFVVTGNGDLAGLDGDDGGVTTDDANKASGGGGCQLRQASAVPMDWKIVLFFVATPFFSCYLLMYLNHFITGIGNRLHNCVLVGFAGFIGALTVSSFMIN